MSVALTELWQMGAMALADAIRSKEASCHEVMEAHLRRIEVVNASINAVVVLLAEQAVEAARAADRAVVAGGELPPLLGVPFTVKDIIDLVGTPTTQGLKAFARAYPTRDSPHVERLKAAGAIPIGKTNLAAFGVRWHCESELWGATLNPWDSSRTPGASSGGDAAALATGMTPLGVGGDGLGSLRWPAQCCGIGSLRATLGRIPTATTSGTAGAPMGFQLMIVEGPMARRVSDLRAAFEVMAGPTWRDPWSVPAPLRGPEPTTPVRVAVVLEPAGQHTAKQVQDGVRRAAAALRDAGYKVEEMEPPSIDAAAKTGIAMLNTPEIRAQLPLMSFLPSDTQRFLTAFYAAAGDPDPIATTTSFATRHSLLQAWGEFQQKYPLILAPIFTDVPFEAGTDLDDGRVAETIRGMRITIAVNALGLPAVAVPVGTADGLPQVVQLIGARYREDLCLDAATALETSLGIITPIDPRQRPASR